MSRIFKDVNDKFIKAKKIVDNIAYNNDVVHQYYLSRHKLNYDDKLKEVGKRIKINHRIDRCINIDVAHGKIETIFAVFSIIKRLVLNHINLNNKGGCNND